MATFDQLPAEQRAIIELVVARGRSYDALADVLQVSAQRVRELARDALVELSPVTGERVDAQWRGQVADYLLGQQSNAESTATRAHLKRSEPARTWALSLLDALDALYGNGDRPAIPDAAQVAPAAADGDEAAVADAETRPRERVRERERLGRERAAAAREPRERTTEREREPERGRDRERERERDEADDAARKDLSPAAQAALRRRRILGAAGALALIAAIVVGVLALTGAFSGDDNGTSSSSASSSTTPTTPSTGTGGTSGTGGTANQQRPQVLGQIPLTAVGGAKAQGVAYILKQGDQQVLAVTAKLPPLPSTQRKAAYNVWLFNSPKDVASIGAQFTTPQGDYQGVGPLPKNYKRFKFIDVSKQPFNNKTGHSGQSLLRGALANLKPVPQNQQPGAQQQPGGTAP